MSVGPDGKHTAYVKQLSRMFHNWFYAGWVVVDNDWAKIPPKTVRGTWPPAVSTEDFERGLRILEGRNKDKQHNPKHFYLLQRLIYMERPNGSLIRLNCQTPNTGRETGGTAYYSLRNTNFNFPCEAVDAQPPAFLWNIQIDTDCLPDIQEAYRTELVDQLGCIDEPEQRRLHNQLKQIDDAETRAARLFVDGKITY